MRFGRVREREEALGHGERFVDLFLRNAVIDELKEADFGRRVPKLFGDLGFALIKAAHVDTRHIAGFRCTDTAESLLFFELGETIGRVA